MEAIKKTKELINVLKALGVSTDVEKSHDPTVRRGLKRLSTVRHFRNSVLIVSKSPGNISKAGRNIPGVDVCAVNELTVNKLAPGARPRLAIWTEGAVSSIESALKSGAINSKR